MTRRRLAVLVGACVLAACASTAAVWKLDLLDSTPSRADVEAAVSRADGNRDQRVTCKENLYEPGAWECDVGDICGELRLYAARDEDGEVAIQATGTVQQLPEEASACRSAAPSTP